MWQKRQLSVQPTWLDTHKRAAVGVGDEHHLEILAVAGAAICGSRRSTPARRRLGPADDEAFGKPGPLRLGDVGHQRKVGDAAIVEPMPQLLGAELGLPLVETGGKQRDRISALERPTRSTRPSARAGVDGAREQDRCARGSASKLSYARHVGNSGADFQLLPSRGRLRGESVAKRRGPVHGSPHAFSTNAVYNPGAAPPRRPLWRRAGPADRDRGGAESPAEFLTVILSQMRREGPGRARCADAKAATGWPGRRRRSAMARSSG